MTPTLNETQPGPVPQSGTEVLRVEHLSKRYAPGFPAVLDDLSFAVHKGEMLALLGPSGCGKTTTLRVIAGFERADQGQVLLDGRALIGPQVFLAPEKRNVGMVFQDYALFPHLNVTQNVMFGLKNMNRQEREERTRQVLGLVGLNIFAKRYPHELSGGQQQRVALARALAPRPKLILMDEPFSNLDAALRHTTRQEVKAILREAGMTAILVTHDQEEALSFADRIMLMRAGKIEQIGTPPEVYQSPRTAFVANFLGRSNLISARAAGKTADSCLGKLNLSEEAKGPVLISIRPEDIVFADQGVPVTVKYMEYKGHDVTYTCTCGEQEVLVHAHHNHHFLEGQQAFVTVQGLAQVLRGS
ncbi:ABC transporter ATP-binding protein [Deinococcus roseus]|uniref:Iron(III) ABC transporter ATP-binding protein n=1 Tax=Deinococcus roseus TaxID=392414 RepID=A0ABQ2CYW2_9DEIO|nr:ABC transporter ATP-binding protein [Deinococcus roseus]GGJ34548.1 iron(III) ABC transporter ATP-binding protein [Deinococcus roseus]